MSVHALPAHCSQLASRGIPAVQRGASVVAVTLVRPSSTPAMWLVVLSHGTAGGCTLTQRTSHLVAARSRVGAIANARAAAHKLAAQLARQAKAPTSPAPAPLFAQAGPVVREPSPPYIGYGPLTCCSVTPIGEGYRGFELELTGAGWDGEIEMVGAQEVALWLLCNELTHALLTVTPQREAAIHRELVARLHARRAYRATAAQLRHAA